MSVFGLRSGVGDWTLTTVEHGILCGRGDMSMESFGGHSDDEGGGGVITETFYLLTTRPPHASARDITPAIETPK